MKKYLLLTLLVLLSYSMLFAQQIEELENWAQQQTESFKAKDIVNFMNGNRAQDNITYGDEYIFNPEHTYDLSAAALDTNHFVVAYRDHSNDGHGTAIVGTVSGSTISYGAEYVFNSGSTKKPRITSLDPTHFVIAYGDSLSSYYAETVIVGSVSGNVISLGSPCVFSTSPMYYYFDVPITSLDANHFVLAYRDNNNSTYGTAVVGTVSGSNISLGAGYIYSYSYNTGGEPSGRNSVTYLDSTRFVITYTSYDNSYNSVAIVGTVSGNTISYGSEYIFNVGRALKLSATCLDSNHFVVAYTDVDNSEHGTAIVGTVSGNVITFGSEYVFFSNWTSYISASSLDANHFVVVYWNWENSLHNGTSTIGNVSGNTISYNDPIVFNPAYSFWQSVTSLDANHFVVAYGDQSGGYPEHIGTAIIGTVSEYPVETSANSVTTCPGNVAVPVTVQDMNDVTEFSLILDYDTTYLSYTGYQNFNTQLNIDSLSVTENSGEITIAWNSTTPVSITSDTLIELLFLASTVYNQTTENLIWDDTNSYYIDSTGLNLETVFNNGQITIDPIPADAGLITGANTICQGTNGESYHIGTIANATSYVWELDPDTAGTIFGSDTIITINFSATYSGQAILSVYGSNICGDGTSSSLIIEVIPYPTANVGDDDEICEGESYLLNGAAENYASINWTTSGDGTFDDPALLAATYTPGTNDISNGTVDLTLTATPNSPCTDDANDEMILSIDHLISQVSTPDGPIEVDVHITPITEYITQSQYADNYIWMINPSSAGIITGTDTIGTVTWNFDFQGYAYIKVTASNNCNSITSDSLEVFAYNSIGITEGSDNDIKVNIVPNPNNGIFKINIWGINNYIDLYIINSSGVTIKHKKIINTNTPVFSKEFDLNNIPKGIYYLKVYNNKLVHVEKLIIN